MQKEQNKKQMHGTITKAPNYGEMPVCGAFGGPRGDGIFTLTFYNDSVILMPEGQNIHQRELKTTLNMSFATLKAIDVWLSKHVAKIEKLLGSEIKIESEEKQKVDSPNEYIERDPAVG